MVRVISLRKNNVDASKTCAVLLKEEDFSVHGVEGLDSCSAETSLLTIQASVTSADERLGDINEDAFNDITNSIIDYDEDEYDPSWHPDMEAQSELLLEEEDTVEEDSNCNDSDDPDYVTLFRVCKGRSLNTGFILEECPSVTMEDTVHDAGDDTDQDDHEEDLSVLEQEQETQHLPQKKQRRQPYRSVITVEVEDDIIGKPASIAYHDCLRQLCEFVALPIDSCKGKDPITQKQCQAKGPFEINIKSRVTAAVIEWLCPQGHIVWRWSSQPTLKFGSQLEDFLMATNVLLTGNNYTKVKIVFNFMNMGMINERYFADIQDNYCVDTIKAFWNARRAKVIANVKTLGPTVALGDGRMDSP
ncbi:unnamed protein product [Boreogadus saida]